MVARRQAHAAETDAQLRLVEPAKTAQGGSLSSRQSLHMYFPGAVASPAAESSLGVAEAAGGSELSAISTEDRARPARRADD